MLRTLSLALRKMLRSSSTVPGPKDRQIINQRGSIAIMTAVSLPVLIGFAALAVDISHLFVVRGELQNAADAAALNGANYLYRPGIFFKGDYDWASAENNALLMLQKNSADGANITSGDIKTGYWDTSSNTFTSPPSTTPSRNDVPAVKVTVSIDAGNNGGPVKSFLAEVLGIMSSPVAATAVAVSASPNTINAGGLLPLVVSTCIYNASWDFTKNPPQPKLDKNGNPIVWSFGPGMSGNSSCGDQSLYTSFDKAITDSNKMKDLFTSGNPNPMSIGGNTYVLDQADNVSKTVFPGINQCSAANPDPAKRTCEYGTVLIVKKTDGSAGNQVIQSFACLHILSATSDSSGNYFISAQLSTLCRNNLSDGISAPNTVFRIRIVS